MSICVACGLFVDPITGFLSVERRPGGGIGCTNTGAADDGIFIEAGSTSVITDPSATITFAGNGTSGSHLSALVRKSTQPCNGIRLDGDGIWAPKACTMTGSTLRGYVGASFPVGLNTGGAGLFSIQNDGGAVVFNNTSDCALHGIWDVQVYGGGVEANPGFDGYSYLAISQDGGPFNIATPETFFRMDNRASLNTHPNGGVVDYNINNLWERNYIHLNPGENHSFAAQVNVKVTAGTGQWFDSGPVGLAFPRFEFHWQLTTEGAC